MRERSIDDVIHRHLEQFVGVNKHGVMVPESLKSRQLSVIKVGVNKFLAEFTFNF